MSTTRFDVKHILHELKHYLPTQTPLKDFIHHNSLHAFQYMKFYDAIFKSSKIFGHQATMPLSDYRKLYEIGRIRTEIVEKSITNRKPNDTIEVWKTNLLSKEYNDHIDHRIGKLRNNWKQNYHIDLDNLVQPFLFRFLCSYLDQGISIWDFPIGNKGFLEAIKELEKTSFASFFKTKRAKDLLFNETTSIESLLKIVVGNEAYYEQYLFDQQFSHRGWSGLVASVEAQPETLLSPKQISLHDLILFELLLEIDNLDHQLGNNWKPIAEITSQNPIDLFEEIENTEYHDVMKIWQDAFEWSYYDEVLAGIQQLSKSKKAKEFVTTSPKSFQALFCIDEREDSIRRHVESIDTNSETFGTPGFFTVEFYFQAFGAKFYDKLCPAPVTPKYLIKEFDVTQKREHDLLYTNKTHLLTTGFLSTFVFGFWSAYRLVKNLVAPQESPAISNAFLHMNAEGKLTVENKNINDIENNLQIGFTVDEMATRVASLLNGIALTKNFAPIVYVVAHGSSSANNPHHGAHDCGACSGRPGSVNARVFALMANNPKVREVLNDKGIVIPTTTQFIGALHDTAADEIEFYDIATLNVTNTESHIKNFHTFEDALDLNAKERSRRFASIDTKNNIKKVRKAIKERSVSLFEPRPELGHGTNTLCIVGKRNLTKGIFLDRRAFLNSYDYKTDLDGTFLTGIMKPLGPVCGGINLEYYFSRVDNYKLGAGTKLPHNVMGLFGVANSSDGDLRPGLPWQMIEVHDPVRLMIIVEHFPEVVLKVIQSVPEMYEWFINEWVHLSVINPETDEVFYFKEGQFETYKPMTNKIHFFKDVHSLLEDAKEMETNHITHATQENLPIYFYNEN
ncbi:DUF2309 domain-containing protein [Flavobacterium sp.]|uniref:YbcC family protein n=1 Tax=Flavobacterium sp. TaxID=239 RepID=UPI00286A91F0|nr:DUF2309 domain-containing protein [Flavobacterium sp.]